MMSEITETQVDLELDDHNITITVLQKSENEKPKGMVILAPAIGIRQGFYQKQGRYFVENGYSAITFDFHGIGLSKRGSLRKVKIRAVDWAEQDIKGVIEYSISNFPDLPIVYLAHSVGGQILGLIKPYPQIKALVFVTVNNGYWRYHKRKYVTGIMLYTLFPIITWTLGYFPGKIAGTGDNVPASVAYQWAKWLRSENYLFEDETITTLENYELYDQPMLSYSFEDDRFAPKEAIDYMVTKYPNTQVTRKHVHPSDYQMKKIGHIGYFREKCKDTLWKETLDWIGSQVK